MAKSVWTGALHFIAQYAEEIFLGKVTDHHYGQGVVVVVAEVGWDDDGDSVIATHAGITVNPYWRLKLTYINKRVR